MVTIPFLPSLEPGAAALLRGDFLGVGVGLMVDLESGYVVDRKLLADTFNTVMPILQGVP